MKILASSLLLLLSLAALAVPAETLIQYKGGVFSHLTNQDLTVSNPLIEKAIITIHGSERNAGTYYNAIEVMAKKQNVLEKTIVMATHFKEPQDDLQSNEFYFSAEGWLSGDEALNRVDVSSFEIMDHIVALLTDKKQFPKLNEIVITGHSAGGQLTQRYAVGSTLEQKHPDVRFRYIVANPGSYLYLTTKRPFPGSRGCPYNDYKFGLNRLNSYMSKVAKDLMVANYLKKDVVYFIGESDTRSDNIDQSCPAVYQGNNRLERGRSYMKQLSLEFPTHVHHLSTVPGIGHTQWGMYSSELGVKVLFKEL